MSHFAKIENGIVTQVIVAEQDFINSGVLNGTWIQTSYNTRGGIHYAANSNTPDDAPPMRGNYAGIGYTYDEINDVFYSPQPFPSWKISAPTWLWEAPVARPTDGARYIWNEDIKDWELVQ